MSSVPTRRELLAWLLAFALVMTVITMLGPESARGEGAEPVATEEKAPTSDGVTAEGHTYSFTPNSPIVLIATGENFPDALAAAAAGGAYLGPVLMVRKNSVPAAVITELERLHPAFIYIAGGSDGVSDGVKATLEGLSWGPTVTRLQGLTRYETAVEVSEALFPTSGMHSLAGFAMSSNLPDFIGSGTLGVDDVRRLSIPDFEVPGSGVLLLTAGAEIFGGPDTLVRCYLEVEGTKVIGSQRDVGLDGTGNSEENCNTEAGYFVSSAGTYDIEFWAVGDSDVDLEEGALTVLWVRNEAPAP